VVATFDRVVFPTEGIVSVRQTLYSAVKEVRAIDPLTVEFLFTEPSAIFIPSIALDWSYVIRKQTLEDNNQDLRRVKDYPGTGPFIFVEYITDEKWTSERNPDYFYEGLPYLDGIEQFHAPGGQVSTLLLGGIADYGFGIAPSSDEDLRKQGVEIHVYPSPVITAFWMNTDKAPFNDVRVRRAIDLVVDRHALNEITGQISRRQVGRWAFPRTEFSLSDEDLLKLPALRLDKTENIKEAKQLMKDAGYENGFGNIDFVQRQNPNFALLAPAVQDILKRHLGIDMEIRQVHVGVWFEDIRRGDFDFTVGAVGTAMADPAAYLPDWYGSSGKQNFSTSSAYSTG
jgi:peptide/nickel transport system substrate-binding protein